MANSGIENLTSVPLLTKQFNAAQTRRFFRVSMSLKVDEKDIVCAEKEYAALTRKLEKKPFTIWSLP